MYLLGLYSQTCVQGHLRVALIRPMNNSAQVVSDTPNKGHLSTEATFIIPMADPCRQV